MKHWLKAVAVVTTAAVLALTGVTSAAQAAVDSSTPANPPTKTGYTLDWAEEFNGTSLDTSKWMDYYLPHWTANRENAKARYTIADGVFTERIDQDTPAWNPQWDGSVKVSSIQTYNADWWHRFNNSMPNNHHEPTFNGYTFKYGYVEMRAKMADTGGGGHQALWLVGTGDTSSANGNAEIDMLETWFSKPNTYRIQNFGWSDPNFVQSWTGCDCTVSSTGDPTTGYHTYGMDWTPTGLAFYYDGTLVKTLNDAPNEAMGLFLGIYTNASSGAPNAVWPKSWSVDYLRVFKKDAGYPGITERIKNRNLSTYLVANPNGNVTYSTAAATDLSSQWTEERTGEGYIRFKNRQTGTYMNTEAGGSIVRHSAVNPVQWTADWTLQNINGYKYIKNRQTGLYINLESKSGNAEVGTIQSTWWSPQWAFDYLATSYSINYSLAGGTATGSNPTTYTSQSNPITLSNPTRAGYTFAGWTGTGLSSPTTTVTIPTDSTGNRSYTATWQPAAYTLSYELNGGTANNPTSYTVDSAPITLPAPTRAGYTFAGWTGTGLSAPTADVSIATGSTGDRTYTATWTPISYAIGYQLGGGTATGSNPTSYSADSGEITLSNPTWDGYVFAGWTGTGLSSPSATVTIPAGSTGDRSYTATWEIGTYALSYELNGGTADNPASYTLESDTITLSPPTRAGYTFAGWTGTGLTEPTTEVSIPTGSTGDRSYTATWTANSYAIDYQLGGGTADGNPTSYSADSGEITLTNPTRDGYVFTGWTGTGLDAPTTTVTIPAGATGDRAYTAHWESLPVVVTANVSSDAGVNEAGWHRSPVSVALSEEDEGATVEYRLNGAGAWAAVSGPVAVTADGSTTVNYRAVRDGIAVDGSEGAVEVKLDRTTTATAVETNPASGSVTVGGTVTATFTATDATSGVAYTEYSTDAGTTWVRGSQVSFTELGAHPVQYRSVDVAGNVEQTKTVTLTVAEAQSVAKVTITSADSPSADSWYQQDVLVRLEPAKAGQTVQYQLNGGTWKTYTSTLTVSANGTTTIGHRLLSSKVVVPGSEAQTVVKLDKLLPTATATRTPSSGTITPRNPLTVAFAGADTVSGLSKLEYRVNSGAWLTAPAEPVLFDTVGDYVVTYRSTDKAGNVSTVKSLTFTIAANVATTIKASVKTVAPGANVTLTLTGFARWDDVAITFNGQPLTTVLTDVNGAAKVTVTVPATTPNGTAQITATGTDALASTTITVKK